MSIVQPIRARVKLEREEDLQKLKQAGCCEVEEITINPSEARKARNDYLYYPRTALKYAVNLAIMMTLFQAALAYYNTDSGMQELDLDVCPAYALVPHTPSLLANFPGIQRIGTSLVTGTMNTYQLGMSAASTAYESGLVVLSKDASFTEKAVNSVWLLSSALYLQALKSITMPILKGAESVASPLFHGSITVLKGSVPVAMGLFRLAKRFI